MEKAYNEQQNIKSRIQRSIRNTCIPLKMYHYLSKNRFNFGLSNSKNCVEMSEPRSDYLYIYLLIINNTFCVPTFITRWAPNIRLTLLIN